MKNKSTIYLLGFVFCILLVISLQPVWSQYLPGSFFGKQDEKRLISINQETITAVTFLHSSDEQIKIIKQNDVWLVNDKPVDQSQIERLLQALTGDSIERVASTNPENFASLGISEDKGVAVTVESAAGPVTFKIGNVSSSEDGYYIKKDSEEKVLVARGQLKSLAQQAETGWRDKLLVAIQPESIQTITVQHPSQLIELGKNQEGNWVAKSGNKETIVGENTVQKTTDAFENLQALGFATPEQKQSFESLRNKTTVKVASAQPVEIILVKSDSEWLAQVVGKDELYTLSETVATAIAPQTQDLFAN